VSETYRAALASVTANRNLRIAQLSSFAAWSSEFVFVTTTTVYAFQEDGAAGAGVLGFLRLLPAAFALPFVGALADRVSRHALLVATTFARALTVGGAAFAAAADQTVASYALVTLSTVCHAAYRPTLAALMPSLCTSPEELAGSNAVRSVLDGLAALLGPLLAAAVLAVFGPAVAFAAVSVLSAVSMLLAGAVRYEPTPNTEPAPAVQQLGTRTQVWDGLHELRRSRHGSIVIVLGSMQCLVRGALTVFAVIVAVDLAAMGQAGVGVLWAGFGVGGLVAAFASLRTAGSSRLGTLFGAGVAMWGLPVVACGLVTHGYVAVAAFTIIGAANALVDVSAFTLLQRVVPDRMLARVLALAEAMFALSVALGSLAVPPIDAALGHTSALIATGCLLPVAAAVSYPLLRDIDLRIRVSTDRIALLRKVGLLRLLPVPAIEALAGSLTHVHRPAGTDVFRKGDIGDRFYLIEAGRVTLLDGARAIRELGPGDSFGEIALMRSVPRTLTARATRDADLAVVNGARFLAAVTGFSATAASAEQIVGQHLAEDERRRGSASESPAEPQP
jgi:MFS family permease